MQEQTLKDRYTAIIQQIRDITTTLARTLRPKPWLYDSYIVFYKQGRLQELAHWVRQQAKPAVYTAADHEDIQLTYYYSLSKAPKFLADQPEVALLVMQTDLDDLLRRYYKLAGRWRVSNKKILYDLQGWDPTMHELLRGFLTAPSADQKFGFWEQMIDRLLAPIGGRQFAKYQRNCSCAQCQLDIKRLLAED